MRYGLGCNLPPSAGPALDPETFGPVELKAIFMEYTVMMIPAVEPAWSKQQTQKVDKIH